MENSNNNKNKKKKYYYQQHYNNHYNNKNKKNKNRKFYYYQNQNKKRNNYQQHREDNQVNKEYVEDNYSKEEKILNGNDNYFQNYEEKVENNKQIEENEEMFFDNLDSDDFESDESEENSYLAKKTEKDVKLDNVVLEETNGLDLELVQRQQEIFAKENPKIVEQNEMEEEIPIKPDRKYSIIVYIVGVILVLALLSAVSYAWFNYYGEGSHEAVANAGTIYVTLDGNTRTLTLNKIYPSTPEAARSRNDNYVDFTILGKNTSTKKDLYYNLTISNGDVVSGKTRIPPQYLMFDLSSLDGSNNETSILSGVSFTEFNNANLNEKIPAETNNEISKSYRVRMWMVNDVLISDSESGADFTQAEFNNLFASIKVSVDTNVADKSDYPLGYVCIRAKALHTEECTQSSDYCNADGYYAAGSMGTNLITYGKLGTSGADLETGDALDCDVNGNGYIDVDEEGYSLERFYYVSPRWTPGTDTSATSFDTSTAVLIYYSNTYNGVISNSGVAYATTADAQAAGSTSTATYQNWWGPVTAIKHLPTTTSWSNVTLKATTRAIIACNNADCTTASTSTSGGTLPINFSYAGYAGRLLTIPEIKKAGCDTLSNLTSLGTTGSLKACNFLMERTKYADSGKATYGPWLENPYASDSYYAWDVYSSNRFLDYYNVRVTDPGARPAIEVSMSKILK